MFAYGAATASGQAMVGQYALPLELTSLVGRDRELVALAHRLKTARLVTNVGHGGIGKTRLGLRLATQVAVYVA
jgi:non-specific serine/threonine protein kinase